MKSILGKNDLEYRLGGSDQDERHLEREAHA